MDNFFGIGMMELFFIALIAYDRIGGRNAYPAIREGDENVRYVRNLSNELTLPV